MDYLSDFVTWKAPIEAVPNNDVKLPNQPIDECTAQAETLATEAGKDKERLEQAGLNVALIDDLVPLSGALRYCQALWMSEYRARQDAQKEWLEQSPLAYELRDEILHHYNFAYRQLPDLRKKVTRIREGAGHADMIQDLVELAVLGLKNPEPLTAIGFDLSLTQQAESCSRNMSTLLAMANGSKDDSSEIKLLRDKAYTLLAERMATIREHGRYVFWRNEERKEKYLNNYKG